MPKEVRNSSSEIYFQTTKIAQAKVHSVEKLPVRSKLAAADLKR